ncbi:MAG: InlB B-repeat-containing protein [Candidatus Peribacteria bacterium]|nr:InlB B-repeat-containing protein [Candidatus Peribacteria bacterium]
MTVKANWLATPQNESMTLPSAGTKTGYIFSGWYTSANC